MSEENRRQTIVGTLNTHCQGRASAEAFNYQGKTNILIRYEDRNLFICECKFWTGPEGSPTRSTSYSATSAGGTRS
jgi:hypothetical protein